jgi:hypothetical protein
MGQNIWGITGIIPIANMSHRVDLEQKYLTKENFMTNPLSDMLAIVNQILDTTVKTVLIPDKTIQMEIRPLDADVLFGLAETDFLMSGAICIGLNVGYGAIISKSSNADSLELEGANATYPGGTPFIVNGSNLGNRTFYLSSTESGNCSIIYTKIL